MHHNMELTMIYSFNVKRCSMAEIFDEILKKKKVRFWRGE